MLLRCCKRPLHVYGKPEIVNTDQGSQFTAQAFVQTVKHWGCHISMDGRGARRYNVFVERLWETVKYERVYLHAYDFVTESRRSIRQYLGRYNHFRSAFEPGPASQDEAYAVMLPMGKLGV